MILQLETEAPTCDDWYPKTRLLTPRLSPYKAGTPPTLPPLTYPPLEIAPPLHKIPEILNLLDALSPTDLLVPDPFPFVHGSVYYLEEQTAHESLSAAIFAISPS